MIARLRGEHQDHWARWRPSPARAFSAAEEVVDEHDDPEVLDDPEPTPVVAKRSAWGHLARVVVLCFVCLRVARALMRWLVLLVVISIAYVAISWVVHQLTPQPVRLPASPRAWLSAYEAAALDNPPQVCSQLLSPQLAAAYAHAAHESCRARFGRVTSSSVTVRRVLEQGSTAVLELRQTVEHREWWVVLDHHDGGWQAVDVLGY